MDKKKKRRIKVTHEEACDLELLAESIIEISNGVKKLRESRLNDMAIALLIQNVVTRPRPTRNQIMVILEAAESLPEYYLREREHA